MPVGLTAPDTLMPVAGVELATIACGIKGNAALDLLLVSLCEGTAVAGVFTQNRCCAAPVVIARERLATGDIRSLLVNSGNANAGTGTRGDAIARQLCDTVAAQIGIAGEQVLPFSTGVIGEQLPVDKIDDAIKTMSSELNADWLDAARAIMTTDTLPKAQSITTVVDGLPIALTGIAKGSGMIHPNMATMLSFLATDACVDQAALQRAVGEIIETTFNCITVDGDTSTNDSYICMATAKAGNTPLDENHSDWPAFYAALEQLTRFLAHAVVRDGEGATRFISITVRDGAHRLECRQVGLTVAHSPLVKTAFFAGDPNLGRILMAIGRSGIEALEMNQVSVWLGGLPVVENGEPSTRYDEGRAAKIMAEEEVDVEISLGMGDASATVWTTDLSYEYVKINAEYRS